MKKIYKVLSILSILLIVALTFYATIVEARMELPRTLPPKPRTTDPAAVPKTPPSAIIDLNSRFKIDALSAKINSPGFDDRYNHLSGKSGQSLFESIFNSGLFDVPPDSDKLFSSSRVYKKFETFKGTKYIATYDVGHCMYEEKFVTSKNYFAKNVNEATQTKSEKRSSCDGKGGGWEPSEAIHPPDIYNSSIKGKASITIDVAGSPDVRNKFSTVVDSHALLVLSPKPENLCTKYSRYLINECAKFAITAVVPGGLIISSSGAVTKISKELESLIFRNNPTWYVPLKVSANLLVPINVDDTEEVLNQQLASPQFIIANRDSVFNSTPVACSSIKVAGKQVDKDCRVVVAIREKDLVKDVTPKLSSNSSLYDYTVRIDGPMTEKSKPSILAMAASLFSTSGIDEIEENAGMVTVDDDGYLTVPDDNVYELSPDNSGEDATLPANDSISPTTPTNVRVQVASNPTQVFVTWSPSTDAFGISGYLLYRNDVLLSSPTTNNYFDSSLMAGNRYVYSVRAFDKHGNISPLSNTATTVVAADATNSPILPNPVKVLSVSISGNPTTLTKGQTYTISWNSENASKHTYGITLNNSVGNTIAVVANPTLTNKSFVWTVPTALADTDAYLQVYAYNGTAPAKANSASFKIIPRVVEGSDITLVSPNGGSSVIYEKGKVVPIVWTSKIVGKTSLAFKNVATGNIINMNTAAGLRLSLDTVVGRNSHQYTIPSTVPAGIYKVVVIIESSNISDSSDNVFLITNPAPRITSVTPTTVTAGTVVTVTGTGFTGATADTIFYNNTSLSGSSLTVTDTTITFTVFPYKMDRGSYDLYVFSNSGESNRVKVNYLIPASATTLRLNTVPTASPAIVNSVVEVPMPPASSRPAGNTTLVPANVTTVVPATVSGVSIVGNPASITKGQTYTISWNSENASNHTYGITLNNSVGNIIAVVSNPTLTNKSFVWTVPTALADTDAYLQVYAYNGTAPAKANSTSFKIISRVAETTLTAPPASVATPRITSVTPTTVTAGTLVTVNGTGFTGATAETIFYNNTTIPSGPVTVTDTKITFTMFSYRMNTGTYKLYIFSDLGETNHFNVNYTAPAQNQTSSIIDWFLSFFR